MPSSWGPFDKPGPRVTDEDIRRFEQPLGHELPADYREFLLEVNGGPAAESHGMFVLQRGTRQDESVLCALHSLFSLNDPDGNGDLATAQIRYTPETRLPTGLLEIGYDWIGGRIVLPLAGAHRGEVWYLDIEDDSEDRPPDRIDWFERRDVWKVAGSFREFVDGLRLDSTLLIEGACEA